MCADITMCNDKCCPVKYECYRYTAPSSEHGQSYAHFQYEDGCFYFLPIPTGSKLYCWISNDEGLK